MAILELNYKSEVLNHSRSLSVALPENDIIFHQKLSVLYLFHGLGDDHTKWLRRTSIESLVKRLPLLVVMPDFEKSFYSNKATGGEYWEHLVTEIIPLIENTFNVIQNKNNTFVAGNSMGGFGALKCFVNIPHLFHSVYSFSGIPDLKALFSEENFQTYKSLDAFTNQSSFEVILHSVFGNPAVISQSENDIISKVKNIPINNYLPKLSLYCGTDDPLVDMNREFSALLTELQIPHIYSEVAGGHTWSTWEECIKQAIEDLSQYLK